MDDLHLHVYFCYNCAFATFKIKNYLLTYLPSTAAAAISLPETSFHGDGDNQSDV